MCHSASFKFSFDFWIYFPEISIRRKDHPSTRKTGKKLKMEIEPYHTEGRLECCLFLKQCNKTFIGPYSDHWFLDFKHGSGRKMKTSTLESSKSSTMEMDTDWNVRLWSVDVTNIMLVVEVRDRCCWWQIRLHQVVPPKSLNCRNHKVANIMLATWSWNRNHSHHNHHEFRWLYGGLHKLSESYWSFKMF